MPGADRKVLRGRLLACLYPWGLPWDDVNLSSECECEFTDTSLAPVMADAPLPDLKSAHLA